LKEACQDGRIAVLPGLGAKSAEKILKSIAWMEQFSARCRLDEAQAVAAQMAEAVKGLPGVRQISVAGSLRRPLETVGDIDLLVEASAADAPAIFDAFTSAPDVAEVLGRGDTKSSVRLGQGRQVDLRVVEGRSFAAALMYFTGSKDHNVYVRQRA